jgi:hypothetical protein
MRIFQPKMQITIADSFLAFTLATNAFLLAATPDANILQNQIQIASNYNDTMLWGTYRPNLYFGTRTRTKETLLTGIAWFGAHSLESSPWESMFSSLKTRFKMESNRIIHSPTFPLIFW